LIARLDVIWIDRDAAHRAHLHALRLSKVADAFSTAMRVDFVDLCAHRDGLIRALWLADITVDALVGNPQGHVSAI
jgi:hypothetical protein